MMADVKANVVNIRVKYIRPKYKNLKEWCADINNVYIGRKNIVFVDGSRFPKVDSIWANPYKIGKDGDLDTVINKYEEYIESKIKNDGHYLNELMKLKGKNLGCWCKPDRCHGDILIKLINKYEVKLI